MTKFAAGNTKAAKLTNEDVMEMRQRYFDEGWSQGRLCRHYGCSINTVGRIVRGESRQKVPTLPPKEVILESAERMLAFQASLTADKDKEVLTRLSDAIAKEPATKYQAEEEKFIAWTKENQT